MTARVTIDGLVTEAESGESLFDCAERLGVAVPTSCFKNGRCRECLVDIVGGAESLSKRRTEEQHLSDEFRLACCAQVGESDVRLETLKRGSLQIAQGDTSLNLVDPDPAVERVGESVRLHGEKLPWGDRILGLAIDVGTTTVVVRLVDLEAAQVIEARSFENPQRFGGSDVMARIRYDEEKGGKLLQRVLLGYLSHAVESFDVDVQTIAEIVVAANSTMRDLLFGLDVASIGQRPYRSVTQHELEEGLRDSTVLKATARKLRLPAHDRAEVYSLPLISGHVGADTTACLLAIDALTASEPFALMDLGTNTELVVFNGSDWFVASCPAGPAFEGGSISCGMPGLDGAIETLRLDESGCVEKYGVVGKCVPRGICGSGLVDALSEFLRVGVMNELGRFVDDSNQKWISEEEGIFVSESDISELAQAKGANVAGVRIVLEAAGLGVDDLGKFYLAGGFASHLNLESAKRIGLIPDLPADRVVSVGNASVDGATIALLSESRRRDVEKLVTRCRHVELETSESFFDHFVDGCQFERVR